MPQKLHDAIDREPDVVKAHKIFTNFEAATQDSTTATHTAVATTLHTMAEKEPKTPKDAKPKPPNVKDAPPKLKPGLAADQFAQITHSYEPYKIQDAYSDYVLRYYELLVQVEDYFSDASTEAVLELVDDTTCKCMRMETERNKKTKPYVKTHE